MSITLLTGIAAVVGLFLLGKGASNTVKDWCSTPTGKIIERTVMKTYPKRNTVRYALTSTFLWGMDVIFTLGFPITCGYVLDPYSGPFVGGVVGILITFWRGRARKRFEKKIQRRR